jgi:hypothetical protein
MYNLGDRSQTVGRARGIRQDVVVGGDVLLFIHPEYDGDVLILGGSRDNHLFHRATQVFLRIFGFGKSTRRFNYNLSTHRRPINSRRIFLREHAKFVVFDLNPGFGRCDFVVQIA